jgi:hypothetical protein
MTTTRGERLRKARERHFKSARAAAKDLGIASATYGAHERAEAPGDRGRDYGPDEAALYAARFQVRPEWLLTGSGPETRIELTFTPPDEKTLVRVVSALENNTLAVEKLSGQLKRLIVTLPEEDHRYDILAEIRRLLAVEPLPRQKPVLEVVAESTPLDSAKNAKSRVGSSQLPRKRRRRR